MATEPMLTWLSDSVGAHIAIAVQSDEGGFVDFNAQVPGGRATEVDTGPFYYGALLTPPRISIRSEGKVPGVYFSKAQSLSMDNTDWNGTGVGFWDQPIGPADPLILNRHLGPPETFATFTGWYRRRVEIRIDFYTAVGVLQDTQVLGTFYIEDVETQGNVATITLVGVDKILRDVSLEGVKNGAEWFRAMPITFLIRHAIRMSDADLAVDVPDRLNMGTFPEKRCTSWGSVPGINESNHPESYRWIPRAIEADPDNPDYLWIGVEAVASRVSTGKSNSALVRLNLSTGRYKIVEQGSYTSTVPVFSQETPVRLYRPAGQANTMHAFLVRERTSVSGENANTHDWRHFKSTNINDANPTWTLVSPSEQPFWPADFCMRRGSAEFEKAAFGNQDTYRDPEGGGWGVDWRGEGVCVPFAQYLDTWWNQMNTQPGESVNQFDVKMGGYTHDENTARSDATPSTDPNHYQLGPGGSPLSFDQWDEPFGRGIYHIRMFMTSGSSVVSGYLRNYLHNAWTPPEIIKISGTPYAFYFDKATGSTTWRIAEKNLDGTTIDRFNVTALGGTEPFYERQITSYSMRPQAANVRELIVSTIEWDDSIITQVGDGSDPPPWSKAALYEIIWTGVAPGGEATVTELWSETPTGILPTNGARTIVHCWTPRLLTNADHASNFSVCVMLDRSNVRGACYGLAILGKFGITPDWIAGGLWKETHGGVTYKGPSSAMGFINFVRDLDDEQKFYFTDQATGQVWSCIADPVEDTVQWAMENRAFPCHESEHHYCTHQAVGVTDSNGLDRYFWGGAPGIWGELTNPHRFNFGGSPSTHRYRDGIYPLIEFSTKPTDIVEMADFGGENAADTLVNLKGLSPVSRLYTKGDGTITVDERTAGTPVVRFVPESRETPALLLPAGASEPTSANLGYPIEDGWRKKVNYKQIINGVTLTPYGVRAGEPRFESIPKAGSTFQGSYIYDVNATREVRMRLTCVAGGVASEPIEGEEPALLWRYSRLLEAQRGYLAITTQSTDSTIWVVGLNVKGLDATNNRASSLVRAGVEVTQAWSVGDFIQIDGGPKLRISGAPSIGVPSGADGTAVGFNVTPETAGVDAPAFTGVTIIPRDGATSSDGEDGITRSDGTIFSGTPGVEATIGVQDNQFFRRGMVVRIGEEWMIVRHVVGHTQLRVVRGAFGSISTSHTDNTAVRAYVYTREAGRLYDVGNTGVRFGVGANEAFERQERYVQAGDSVIIKSPGLSVEKLGSVRTRVEAPESRIQYKKKDQRIDNRFLDPVRGDAVAQAYLDEFSEPRIMLTGIRGKLWGGGLGIGDTVSIEDERIVPGGALTNFEIIGIDYDLGNMTQTMTLRAYTVVSGAGGAAKAAPAATPSAAERGRRGRR